jgi:hypothetical protein
MTLLNPNQIDPSFPDMCHVCHTPLRACDNAILHDGYVKVSKDEQGGDGVIGMHLECATILAMRLIADVVKQNAGEPEPRVVDSLRTIRETYYQKDF